MFLIKIPCKNLKLYINHVGGSGVKVVKSRNLWNDVTKGQDKSFLSVNNLKTSVCAKNYSESFKKKFELMDFPVRIQPCYIRRIKWKLMSLFLVKKLDTEFNMEDFLNNTKTALEIVSKLISECRFAHLDGLLTVECKREVEKNVKSLYKPERKDIAIKKEDILSSFTYDLNILEDEKSDGKKFLEITVVHKIWRDFAINIQNFHTFKNVGKQNFTVYNCRFIKDCSEGVNSCWIINAINFHNFSFIEFN